MNSSTDELKFLLKHSSIYGVGNMLNRAVAFLLLPLYTHFMTPSDYGVLELIDVTTGLIGIVVGLGVASAISRFYYDAETEADRRCFISSVYLLVALAAGLLLALANHQAPLLARLVLSGERYTVYFQVAFGSLLLGLFIDVGLSYLRLLYKSTLFVAFSTLMLIVTVTLNVVMIVHLQQGAFGILCSTLIARSALGIPLTLAILWRTGLHFSAAHARALLKYSLPLIPSSVAMAIFNYSDRYLIKHYVSIADAGVYGLANKIGGVFHGLVTGPFIMTFLPRRFELAARQDAPQIFRSVFDWFFVGLLLLSLGLAVFVDEIMVVMTAPAFHRAGALVPLILLGTLVFGIKYHVDFGILYAKRTEYYLYANAAASLVQLPGAWLLVRAFGVWGAAWASLLAVTVNTTLLYLFSARFYAIDFDLGRNAKLLVLAIGAFGLSRLLDTPFWALTVFLKIAVLCGFVAAVVLTRLVSEGDLRQARALTAALWHRLQLAASVPA